jgi:membrane-associated phospholipid phosphatase
VFDDGLDPTEAMDGTAALPQGSDGTVNRLRSATTSIVRPTSSVCAASAGRQRQVIRGPDFALETARARGRVMAIITALCAIGVVLLAVVVGQGPLPVDLIVRDALHAGQPVPPLLDALNIVGGALVWDPGVAVLAAVLFLAHRRADAAWLAGAVVVGEMLDTGIKLLVDRPRPPGIAVSDLVTQASFPSGHVTRTAITLALLVFVLGTRPARVLGAAGALVVTILMGAARIESGEHWPTDVLGAFFLAAFVVAVVAALRARFSRPAPGPQPPGPPDSSSEARSP